MRKISGVDRSGKKHKLLFGDAEQSQFERKKIKQVSISMHFFSQKTAAWHPEEKKLACS